MPMEAPLEPYLRIIDAHHHLWKRSPAPQYRSFPVETLAAEREQSGHNIVASVFVDCQYAYLDDGPAEFRPVGETRAVERDANAAEAAGIHGLAAAIVGHVDMTLGAHVEPILLAHINESPSRFRGVRQVTPWHPGLKVFGLDGTPELLRSPRFLESLGCLARLGLTFDAYVLFPQLWDVAYLARSVPEATIVLDHVAAPRSIPGLAAAEASELWHKGLVEVASCPNVVVKLGGLFMHHEGPKFADSVEAASSIREHILPCIDLFSPSRCMFESNFPVDEVGISYGMLWNAFKRITAGFGNEEREALFFGTAAKTYKVKL